MDNKQLQEQAKNEDLTEAFPRVGSGLASTHYSLTVVVYELGYHPHFLAGTMAQSLR